ncbi:MAG: hypothetical protein KKA73_03085 [Chloroflexi bacterium]|nr:hypothetical protein [Chloroflexota bacterium]MBU1746648.1 hypothetical protein [Chloroflexota bacterium]
MTDPKPASEAAPTAPADEPGPAWITWPSAPAAICASSVAGTAACATGETEDPRRPCCTEESRAGIYRSLVAKP